MSATSIIENKYARDSSEDELSTSAGGSDAEANAVSGDDEPLCCSTPLVSGSGVDVVKVAVCRNDNIAKKGSSAELSRKCLACFSALVLAFLLYSPLLPTETNMTEPVLVLVLVAALAFGTASKPSQRKSSAVDMVKGSVLVQKAREAPGLVPFSRPSVRSRAPESTSRFGQAKQQTRPGRPSLAPQTGSRQASTLTTPACKPKVPPVPSPVAPMPPPVPQEFEQTTYRKELSDVLRSFGACNNTGGNVGACVRRIRIQNVPKERQAAEFSDILTRAAEEHRGVARRLSFAFAVGLAAGEPNSAFDREECAAGLKVFFDDVLEDLAAEVPRLRNKLANEFVPTLRTVFSPAEIVRLVPSEFQVVLR